MSQTIATFDPAKAGFRVSEPITRKARKASSKEEPRPQYADAVEFTFQNGQPLEVTVPLRSAPDTVRALKRAARYLDRHRGRGPEVRVQISVESLMVQKREDGELVFDEDGKPVMVEAKPRKSVVKFLGHQPFALGRRIAKLRAEAEQAGAEAGEQAAQDALAERRGQHRRRTAVTRTVNNGRKSRASLRAAVVRAVISPSATLVSGIDPDARVVVVSGSFPDLRDTLRDVIAIIVSPLYDALTSTAALEGLPGRS